MKQEQIILCEKHKVLLDFIWTWGWGCALQPLLVDVSMYFDWHASQQMCRRAIRELRKVGLLKAKTWLDGKSEILILTKPAIAFVTGKDAKEISSFPKHSTRDSEILSICRMMYILEWTCEHGIMKYITVDEIFKHNIYTIHLHIGELLNYWERVSFYKQFKCYEYEKHQLEVSQINRLQLHMNKGKQVFSEKEQLSAVTIESLHRRGISIIDIENEGATFTLCFSIFNIHDLTAKKVMDYYVLCHDWVKSLHLELEAKLTVCCLDEIQQKSLEKNLMKIHKGRPFWEYSLARKADISKGIPIVVVNTRLKEKYMKVGYLS